MTRLIVLIGPDAGKEFEIPQGESSLGRADANAMILSDPQVSRRHFDLQNTDGQIVLTDRGSGNGTKINGIAIKTATLQHGDRLVIGDTTLFFSNKGSVLPGVIRTVSEDAGSAILSRPDIVGSDWLRMRLAHLGVLYEASAAVNEILDVDQLIGRLLDLTLKTTEADVGHVLLADEETGEWTIRASRSKKLGPPQTAISRTILDYVKDNRVGVFAADATTDDRFAGGESIIKHGIREVIAVPMKGRHDTVGAMVVETIHPHAQQETKFTEDHLTLASAIAHQAALAIEETRYYRAMVNAEKLAAVGTAVAHLSHHIKNIMHGIRFGGDMVNRGLADNDQVMLTKGWSLVERNQARIDDLIHDMLGYSKEREPMKESVNLTALIHDVIESVRGRCGENGVTLEFTTVELPVIECDREGIYRALLNVISNAVDAVLDLESPQVNVEATLPPDGKGVEILVTDSGPGVPDDQREEIFKPFISTKGSRGTGLGLPVSRKILREHGGDLSVVPGPGGRFRFWIPFTA